MPSSNPRRARHTATKRRVRPQWRRSRRAGEEASVGKKARRARLAASGRARRLLDKRRRKCRLNFDELHARFIGSDSLETIAKDAGISGARLTYLYHRFVMLTVELASPPRRANAT